MLIPDFTDYSLALIEGGKVIYKSAGGGLRPLWDALEQNRDKNDLILHDKVMGLAAARLVVHSGMIAEVFTFVASAPASAFLEIKGIRLSAPAIVANILTKDKTAICPGEVIALETDNPQSFLLRIQALLNLPIPA